MKSNELPVFMILAPPLADFVPVKAEYPAKAQAIFAKWFGFHERTIVEWRRKRSDEIVDRDDILTAQNLSKRERGSR